MKIAFVGKGGSGKTTLAALFSRYVAAQGLPVLAIDADINQHLAATLGVPHPEVLPAMGNEVHRIKEYVKGTDPRISSLDTMVKTTPPGSGSCFIDFDETNPLFDYFSRSVDSIRVMATGAFTEDDLGIKCYHSKTGAVELLLNHLIDKKNEYVVVDMTAGADAFASGLFTKFDVTVLVVEPTLKGVGVYQQYKHYAQEFDVTLCVVGNKVFDGEDATFLKEHVGEDLLAIVPFSKAIQRAEQTNTLSEILADTAVQKALATLLSCLDATEKDWSKFYKQILFFHQKNAVSWANASTGTDLTLQIDPDFSWPLG